MPWLARAWRDGRCPDAHAVAAMPARTNVNHATLTTGVEPEAHGITGNAFWGRTNAPPRKLGGAGDLLVETVFTVAHERTPPLRTAAAVGKGKLQLMFAAVAGRQAAPDRASGGPARPRLATAIARPATPSTRPRWPARASCSTGPRRSSW